MKLDATHVSVDDFVDQYFQISFNTEDPDADLDLSAPLKPYLLIQRQFEDDHAGVCYIETHEPDRYAGHFRLYLVELAPSRLVFDIDRATRIAGSKLPSRSLRSGFERSSASFVSFSR
jgi:hypothetical protein